MTQVRINPNVGPQGPPGPGTQINASGTTAGRATYDDRPLGFTYADTSVTPVALSIKQSAALGDWSPWFPFQGPTGATGPPGANGVNGTNGAQGLQGDPGADAYEVAVAQGFVGTRAEWVASLKGPQGPAGQNGAPGLDGAAGPAGPAGEKGGVGPAFAYDAVGTFADRGVHDAQAAGFAFFATDLGNLYIKNTATLADWSPAIPYAGPKGDRGDVGPQGLPGPVFLTVRALIAGNIAHSGVPSAADADGVTLASGNLVFDLGFTTPAHRGPWSVRLGAWVRPPEWTPRSRHVYISEGTLYRDREYRLSTPDPITLDTTPLAFVRSDVARAEAYADQQVATSYPQNYIVGLRVVRVDDTSYTVQPGAAYVPSVGRVVVLSGPVALSPGAGLPALPFSANARFSVFLNADGTVTAEQGTAPSAPYFGGAKTKAGNSATRYLDSIRASSDGARLLHQRRNRDEMRYLEDLGSSVHSLRIVNLAHTAVPFTSGANNRQVADALGRIPRYSAEAILRVLAPNGTPVLVDYDHPAKTTNTAQDNVLASSVGRLGVPLTDLSTFVWLVTAAPTAGNLIIDILGYRETLS